MPRVIAALYIPLAVLLCTAVAVADTRQSKPLHFGPISYFEQHCAKCHGSMGSNYGKTFGAGRNEKQLFRSVKEMCDGPGNAPLEGEELLALVAFHRALAKKQLFISWTSAEGGKLTGEVSPGTRVTLKVGDQQTTAIVKNERWIIKLPRGVSAAQAEINASNQGRRTTLRLGVSSYSHDKP